MKNAKREYGIGLEMEGFIVNGERAVERIDGMPASQWTAEQIAKHRPQIRDGISFEQASVMLEVKTPVCDTENQAVKELLAIRTEVDRCLAPVGAKLIFSPVMSKPFEFVAATTDKNSRTHQLIKDWSKTTQGKDLLYATAIASMQVNDSRPFRGVPKQRRLERARRLHNLYIEHFNELDALNRGIRDFRGKTRMDNLMKLIPTVKAERFAQAGYLDPREAALPKTFVDIEKMKRWMMAHSGVDQFEKARSKNEHGVHAKIKRLDEEQPDAKLPWVVESRVFDAVDDEKSIKLVLATNSRLLALLESIAVA